MANEVTPQLAELASLPITNQKEILNEQYKAFDIAQDTSEDDFNLALTWVFNFLLFDLKSWQEEIVRNPKLKDDIPLLDSFPLVCRARGEEPELKEGEELKDQKRIKPCRYYDVCPVMKKLKGEEQDKLVGTPCRVDKLEGIKLFTTQIKDLRIDPSETSNIIQVAQIVRLLIQTRRIDWELSIQGMAYKEISTYNPVTGVPAYELKVNQLLKESRAIESSIAKLQSQLLATRKDRAQAATVPSETAQSLKNLLVNALKQSPTDTEAIDAEFTDDLQADN